MFTSVFPAFDKYVKSWTCYGNGSDSLHRRRRRTDRSIAFTSWYYSARYLIRGSYDPREAATSHGILISSGVYWIGRAEQNGRTEQNIKIDG